LKWKTYDQLHRFLQARQFPQAIALAEALVARLPADVEARQWLAISYQIWGRALIAANQLSKAKVCLKKALKTDPYNRALWLEVQQDFQKLE
jgi:tetratricopeptide (TPR) repeat protein